eukprot:309275_1
MSWNPHLIGTILISAILQTNSSRDCDKFSDLFICILHHFMWVLNDKDYVASDRSNTSIIFIHFTQMETDDHAQQKKPTITVSDSEDDKEEEEADKTAVFSVHEL